MYYYLPLYASLKPSFAITSTSAEQWLFAPLIFIFISLDFWVDVWSLKSLWDQAYLCRLMLPYQLGQGHKKSKSEPLRCINLDSPWAEFHFLHLTQHCQGGCAAHSVCGHKACKELWNSNWCDTAHARSNLSFILRPPYIMGTLIYFSLPPSGFLDCFSYSYVQHYFFQKHFHLNFSFMYKEKLLKWTNGASDSFKCL